MNEYLNQFSLDGRVALVTGASEGIGRHLAIGLARAGADIVICSRRMEKLCEVKEQIQKAGKRAEALVVDVRKIEDIQNLRAFVMDRFGKLDILINNAGFAVRTPAWDVTESEWNAVIDTDLKAVFFCSQILGGIMRSQNYGKIINIGSTFSRTVSRGRSSYAAAKAGVSHLTEALATEWASVGIRVNALGPTAVKTPSREKAFHGELLARLLSRIPLGRLATEDDLIGAAIFLASPASDFVTGHTLFVDGGWIAAS